jgi:cell wall-associated NlpC family hydrolase
MTGRTSRAIALLAGATMALSTFHVGTTFAHEREAFRKQRQHIEDRARSEYGRRYTYGGESPRKGFDCSGFTSWVFEDHGADLGRTTGSQFRAARKDGNRRVHRRSRLHTGDLVFFKTTKERVGHAGIYVGKGKFISSTSSRGVRIDSVYDRYYWGKRWVGATRLDTTRPRTR